MEYRFALLSMEGSQTKYTPIDIPYGNQIEIIDEKGNPVGSVTLKPNRNHCVVNVRADRSIVAHPDCSNSMDLHVLTSFGNDHSAELIKKLEK